MGIPSIRAIRSAIGTIPGAIIDRDPLFENVSEGTGLAAEVKRFDPDASSPKWPLSDDAGEAELAAATDAPFCFFEVPPELTDQDIAHKLGDDLGHLQRLQQIKGIDAFGWYVTFHQNIAQFGVQIPIEGVARLALIALQGVQLPIERKLEVAFYAILRHELFHFAADCMAANWELSLDMPIYWPAKTKLRNAQGYIELEEALANAYMLRGLRHPIRKLQDSSGSLYALRSFCGSQPEGYRAGPQFARSRAVYIDGCRELSKKFQREATTESESYVARDALDTLIFYPDVVRIDWRRCPIIIHDRFGLLHSLGIGISFFETIPSIVETSKFKKALGKLDNNKQKTWHRRKADLARSVRLGSLNFQPWPSEGPDCYSVNIDGNYRVHIRRDQKTYAWIAENVGDHKTMGHG